MKYYLASLILCLVVATSLFAQEPNYWQRVSHFKQGNVTAITTASNGYVYAANIDSGLYRSIDHGVSWQLVKKREPLSGAIIRKLVIDTNHRILANWMLWNTISTDSGKTWKEVYPEQRSPLITLLDAKGGIYWITESKKCFTSWDFGTTWFEITAPVDQSSFSFERDSRNNIYYLFNGIVYRSIDSGKTWSQSLHKIQYLFAANDRVFASSLDTLFYSLDQGESWETIYLDSTIGSINNLVFDNRYYDNPNTTIRIDIENKKAFRAAEGGPVAVDSVGTWFWGSWGDYYSNATFYRSTDRGKTWMQTGYAYPQFYQISYSSDGSLFAVSRDRNVYRLSNKGGSWQMVYRCPIYTPSGWSVLKGDSVGTYYHLNRLFTTNNGATWDTVRYPSVGLSASYAWGNRELIASSDSQGIYYSSDHGNHWEKRAGPLNKVRSIGRLQTGELYAVGPMEFYLSSDKGYNWKSSKFPVTISPDPFNVTLADDGISIHVADRDRNRVVSNDHGETWQEDKTFPYGWPIFYYPLEKRYIVGSNMVWSPKNREQMISGLEDLSVFDFTIDSDGVLYAATSSGVFKHAPTLGVGEIYSNTLVTTLYPNPANQQACVSFKTNEPVLAHLSISNMLGAVVKESVNYFSSVGTHSINIKVADLPPGLYFYRLNTDKVYYGILSIRR